MTGVAAPQDMAERLVAAEGGVHFFPIRHHSPACAMQLQRAFAEIAPRIVLIEMPEDFISMLPLITDAATRPPVAIVAVAAGKGKETREPSYWPISASAPEYIAMRLAHETGASVVFCDLAVGARRQRDAPDGKHAAPNVLTHERIFDHSAYIQALVERTGCRDWNESWDRLFESRIGEPDWRRFFGDMVVYCALARQTYADGDLESDETLARESVMQFHLEAAIARKAGPIAVVTGGFHTPPLLMRETRAQTSPVTLAMRPYLVRFSHGWLDRINGYASGMPSPLYYERLLAAAREPAPLQQVAESVFLDLARRLRKQRPALAPRIPALAGALRQAIDLAALRGLAGPGRMEIFDAARSCFLKDEDPRHGAPILDELSRDLMGQAIGDVPPGAGSPPIVEAARKAAQALRFNVTDAIRRTRDLDIHRNADHVSASRFLHAMALLGTDFGRCEQGPDYAAGVDLDALFEIWSYAWSPQVEAALIEKAAGYDTIAAACIAHLRWQAGELEREGKGRSAAAAVSLMLAAAQCGLEQSLDELLPLLEQLVQEDAELARVCAATRSLFILWRARRVLGMTGSVRLAQALKGCYRRAIDLMRLLPQAGTDKAGTNVAALADLREVLDGAPSGTFDRSLFDDTIAALLDAPLEGSLAGAIASLAVLSGRAEPGQLASILTGALGGANVQPEECVAPLAAMLTLAPELLRRLPEIRASVDAGLASLGEDRFIELLPHLRLAFTALNPVDARNFAASVAGDHKADAEDLLADLVFAPGETAKNLKLSAELERLLLADGLGAWLDGARP